MTTDTPKPSSKGMSLSQLSAKAAGDTPHMFNYVLADGTDTGVVIHVLGAQCERVSKEINRLVNERRKSEAAIAEIRAAGGLPGTDFVPVENEIEFGKRLAAVRICGWDGIDERYSAENAYQLVLTNGDISAEVVKRSNNAANFMKVSSPKS